MTYRDDSAYGFPKGAVFAKTFLLDTIPGDPSSRIFWETRLLVKAEHDGPAEKKWYGFSYRWTRDQSDGLLVDPETGLDTVLTLRRPDGSVLGEKKWNFPSQNACWRCHLPRGRQVLGFFTAQLNRPLPEDGSRNQLQALALAGYFGKGTLPDFQRSHRWVPLEDASLPVEERARSYLASNCSFCHGLEGFRALGAFMSALHDFDWFKRDAGINYLNKPGKTDYGIPGALVVYGGSAEKSIVIHRMKEGRRDCRCRPWPRWNRILRPCGWFPNGSRDFPPPSCRRGGRCSRAKGAETRRGSDCPIPWGGQSRFNTSGAEYTTGSRAGHGPGILILRGAGDLTTLLADP